MVSDMNRRISEDLLGKLANQIDEARSSFPAGLLFRNFRAQRFPAADGAVWKLVNVVASPHASRQTEKSVRGGSDSRRFRDGKICGDL